MAFNSLEYALLTLVTVSLFFAVRGRARWIVLLLASVIFYGAWSLPFVGLIFGSAIVDYLVGRQLERHEKQSARRAWLALSLVVNLGVLGYFKYSNFFLENLHLLAGGDTPILDVLLPPGISFYTFQTLSYSLDVYRKKIPAERSFLRFAVFVSFFPQLIAGPIERAERLLGELERAETKPLRIDNLVSGLQMVVWGLFKKVVIADNLGAVADAAFASPTEDGWVALVGVYAFTLQIYCDFSAYSEIARGTARLFGVELMRNFDQPYLTHNIQEFWRRWHISLSNWFRDYVYIPLGGSRLGKRRALLNLAITMFLSGLWHGAAWTFVIWGLFHGALLLAHALTAPDKSSTSPPRGLWWKWPLTFHAVALGWILFRADGLDTFVRVAEQSGRALVGLAGAPTFSQLAIIAFTFGFLLVSALDRRYDVLKRVLAHPTLSAPLCVFLLLVMSIWGATGETAFIYFQF